MTINNDDEVSIIGDFEEEYQQIILEKGTIYANCWFIIHILRSTPYTIKESSIRSISMLKNNLRVTIRHLINNKIFSFVNISGLTIGMTCFILIMLWVQNERSYDEFHERIDDLYCLQASFYSDSELTSIRYRAPVVMGPALEKELPEIEAYTRLESNSGWAFSYNNSEFKVENAYQADHSIFTMFSFSIIKGDKNNALLEPNTAAISESLAEKIFGMEDPIGKILKNEWWDGTYKVTAVFEDIPANSHIKFDLLGSIHAHVNQSLLENNWYDFNVTTYVMLDSESDISLVQEKINNLYKPHLEKNQNDVFALKPVKDIHLFSEPKLEERVKHSDVKYVNLLFVISLIIILSVWINYINMTTIQAFNRSKEIGIKKILGVKRIQLLLQFLSESILLNIIAVIGALTITKLILSQFNKIFGLSLSLSQLNTIDSWLPLLSFFLFGSIITGLSIAFTLTSFKPLNMIKGIFGSSQLGFRMRKYLVLAQFTAMIVLLISLSIVFSQLNFMKNYDKGMEMDKIILVKKPNSTPDGNLVEAGKTFVNALLNHSTIESVTLSEFPGKNYYARINLRRENQNNKILLQRAFVDHNFIPTYKIKLLAGINFSDNYARNDNSIIINETALRKLGFQNPQQAVNQYLKYDDDKIEIIGVIQDYNQLYLKQKINPICLCTDFVSINDTPNEYFSVRMNSNNVQDIIQSIKQEFSTVFPHTEFDYLFLEQYFNEQYKFEQQMINMFILFALLSLVIAGLGLWGVSSYTILRRTKEAGIRKVLGASVLYIVIELTRDLTKWIILANLFAWPIAYYAMHRWLQNFAYRISIEFWIFLTAGTVVLMIALLTVSWQAIKTASANPVKSLRYE